MFAVFPEVAGSGGVVGQSSLFIFRPGEPSPSGNVYSVWASLVTDAAAVKGPKAVYFDNTLAPCSIPTGIWDFASCTYFFSCDDHPAQADVPLTVDDGAVLRSVFHFGGSLAITSNSKSPVIVSPLPGARYTFSGTTTLTQADPAGTFIRSSTGFVFSPVEVVTLERARILTGNGPAISVTGFGAFVNIYSLDDSVIQANTVARNAGTFATGYTVDSASIDTTQAGIPGGVLTVNLLSTADKVLYNDTLVAPPLGATQVQAAIDALKAGGAGPLNLNRVDCSVNSGSVESPYNFTSYLRTQTAGNVVGGFNGGGIGNKSILGYRTADLTLLSAYSGLQYTWKSLATSTSPLLVYANMVVEPDPIGAPGQYKIFVVDPAAVAPLNVCTTVLNGDGSSTTTNNPALHNVQVVNDLLGVIPAVNLGPLWQDHSYTIASILAVYPNARFREAASGDGGLPKLQTTPAFMLITGDSATNALLAFSVAAAKFNGVAV